MTARYCGQLTRITAYGNEQPTSPRRWKRILEWRAEHRATCITCRAR